MGPGIEADEVGATLDVAAGDDVGEGTLRQPPTSTAASARPIEVVSGVRKPVDRAVIYPLW